MDIVDLFLEKGILISQEVIDSPELLEKLSKLDFNDLEDVDLIDNNFFEKNNLKETEENKKENKGYNYDKKIKDMNAKVKILFSYDKQPGKISVQNFVSYFNRRFEKLTSFLRQRTELQNSISISRVLSKKDNEPVSIIGIISAKSVTKTGKFVVKLEDPSGIITAIVSDRNKDAFELARDLTPDEVIGVEAVRYNDAVFVNKIYLPDIPISKELKKGPIDESIALLGDPHFGSRKFLKEEFEDFLEWINQKKGTPKQRELASKVKYIVISGDLVEGVGVYPSQEKYLDIKDIKEQYDMIAEYIKQIPKNISIIICPGNHDVGRIAEPQLAITHNYAESIQKLPNIFLVSNPSIINLGAADDFPGFDMLLYHGFSLIYYAENIPSIREAGGQKRADMIMQFLLKRRHLAPTHTSNLYVPDTEADPLVIDTIPDFFVTGHIHRVNITNYRNITLANCSCWTDISEDQEKRGLVPQPAKVPIINLKTREVKIINFFRKKADDLDEDSVAEE